jgi:hypothetical protein
VGFAADIEADVIVSMVRGSVGSQARCGAVATPLPYLVCVCVGSLV